MWLDAPRRLLPVQRFRFNFTFRNLVHSSLRLLGRDDKVFCFKSCSHRMLGRMFELQYAQSAATR